MIDQILIACALFAGVLLGLLFFGGLWWTVQKAISSKQPGLLFAGSLLLRTILTLAGFYLVGGGSWHRFVACLIGFVFGRFLITRSSQARSPVDGPLLEEGVR